MPSECDLFFDSYGCVFKSCEGYQSPFPLVKLHSPTLMYKDTSQKIVDESSLVVGVANMQKNNPDRMITPTSTLESLEPETAAAAAATACLCSFNLNEQNGCKSFYHLLETSPRKPIRLCQKNCFYAKLEVHNNVYGTLSFSTFANRSRSTTSDGDIHLYRYLSKTKVSSVVLNFAKAMSLTSHSIWSIHSCESGVKSEPCIHNYEYSELFHSNKTPLLTLDAKCDANSVIDVISAEEETYVFNKHSIYHVDRREGKCVSLHENEDYSIENCGVVNSVFCNFITFSTDNVLRVWDDRYMLRPLWEQRSFEYLTIRTSSVKEVEEFTKDKCNQKNYKRTRVPFSPSVNIIESNAEKNKDKLADRSNSVFTNEEIKKYEYSSTLQPHCLTKNMLRSRANYILLLSSSQVAVMDVDKLTILGAHELADGVVLDAVLLGRTSCTSNDCEDDIRHTSSELLRLCTSSSSGMIYDITMAC